MLKAKKILKPLLKPLLLVLLLFVIIKLNIFHYINYFLQLVFGFCGYDFMLLYIFLLELTVVLFFLKRRRTLTSRGNFLKRKRSKIWLIIFLSIFIILDTFILNFYLKHDLYYENKRFCSKIALDYGKICYDSNECAGECLAIDYQSFRDDMFAPQEIVPLFNEVKGKCSSKKRIRGCSIIIQNGAYNEICFD